MDKQETPRQQKINRVLQQEIAKVLQQAVSEGSIKNLLVSVTKVRVTSDLSIAKIYLSIFPVNDAITYIDALKENRSQLRHDLAQRMKNQLRRFPELHFYLDDSLDYIEGINEELRNGTNPLINPESLDSRKKK
jgi:ribosome-binding factor A